ncbi:MAG: glycosyltransferase [Bacteroidales bacterium]|nr:glycosyltransferase [Bacteroidales bacterium]
MKSFFSIITICYNSSKTIERTIKSVLAQSYIDFEYIIVDGDSKDNTMDIVKQYEPLFGGRLKWVSEPDKGIYNAMNKGILRSTGDVIGIVNSDDWLEPNALQILVDEINQDPSNREKILTGEMLFHYDDGTTLLFPTSYERYEYFAKRYRMGLNHPATFVPRSIYDRVGIFDEKFRLYADADFIIRCYEAGVGVHFIHKVLSNMADGGASNVRSKKELNDSLLKYQKHCKTKREYFKYAAKARVTWCLRGFIPEWYVRWYRQRYNKK